MMKNCLQIALDYARKKYPEKSGHLQCSFANSVSYLVTGMSGGYGGPSIREHAVSRMNTIAPAGRWNLDDAIAFCEEICFGPLPDNAIAIYQSEACFDDDPEDLEAIKKR